MSPITSSVNRAHAQPLSSQVKSGPQQQAPFEPAVQLERPEGVAQRAPQVAESARVARVQDQQEALSLSRAALVAKGYDQALRGSGEQFSFVQTTLSAVRESSSTLEELHAIAREALNPELSGARRAELGEAFRALSHAMSKVAAKTRFQGERLLNRPVTHLNIEGEDVRLKSVRPETLGRQARALTYGGVVAEVSLLGGDGERAGEDHLTLNGVKIRDSRAEDDTLSTYAPFGSAIAKAAAINAHQAETGVSASVEPTVTDGVYFGLHSGLVGFNALGHSGPIQAAQLKGGEALLINGVRVEGVEVQPYDADGALRAAINSHQAKTGVDASVGSRGELILRALDGRNIHLSYEGAHDGRALEAQLGLLDGAGGTLAYTGRVTLSARAPIEADFGAEVSEALGGVVGASGGLGPVVLGVDRAAALDAAQLGDPAQAAAALQSVEIAREELSALLTELERYQARLEGSLSALEGALPSRSAPTSQQVRALPHTPLTTPLEAKGLAERTQGALISSAARALRAQANHAPDLCAELLDPHVHEAFVELRGVGPTSIFA